MGQEQTTSTGLRRPLKTPQIFNAITERRIRPWLFGVLISAVATVFGALAVAMFTRLQGQVISEASSSFYTGYIFAFIVLVVLVGIVLLIIMPLAYGLRLGWGAVCSIYLTEILFAMLATAALATATIELAPPNDYNPPPICNNTLDDSIYCPLGW